MVLDDGSQPLPLYVGRHPFPWDQGALTSWYSGPLHPDNGAWHSVTACLHGALWSASPGLHRSAVRFALLDYTREVEDGAR